MQRLMIKGEITLMSQGGILINLPAQDKTNMKKVVNDNEGIVLKSGVLDTISSVIKLKDPYLATHQERVKKLAVKIAQKMKLPSYQVEAIRIASLLHDIGKISVPNEILYKPGQLSNSEFEVIKKHSTIGSELIKSSNKTIAKIVLQHHEKLDGSGYPKGINSEDILLETKVLTVADVVEAICSHRPYRPALGIEEALTEIKKNKGILYDEEVTDICVKIFLKNEFQFHRDI